MTVKSTDQTEAADQIVYLIDSLAGTASATAQKLLTDDTTGQTALAGDPVDLALTADEQATLIAAADASLTAILAARMSAAPAASGTDTVSGVDSGAALSQS